MTPLTQFRDPHLSLFQSAVDEVLARKSDTVTRPDPEHHMVQMAATEAQNASMGAAPDAVGGVVAYCASLARLYGVAVLEGRTDDANRYHAELTQKMGVCDPDWADTAIKYGEFLLSKRKIPYRVYRNVSDFVIDGKLPANARVAVVGDWGTGQQPAITVLQQIARKNPDVVIHMGDVYYSGTDFEMQNYFYNIWKETLDLTKIPTFTLSETMICFPAARLTTG